MATYYAINAGGNFSAGGTWSTTATKDATRTGGATAPTNADTCILDDYSGAVTVDHTTACLCKILDCTSNGNYASTLTFTAAKVLFVSGNVIFSATMTIAGTGTLTINAACALTPGVTFTGSVSLAGTTVTLGADWTITGSLTSASGTNVMNGNTCYIGGSLTATVALSGTTTLVMNGTGTISGTGTICNNLTVTGSCNLSQLFYQTGTFNCSGGTILGTGRFYVIGSMTFNTGTRKIPDIYIYSICTITLQSKLICGDFSSSAYPLTLSGYYDFTVDTFRGCSASVSRALIFVSGTTVTINNLAWIVNGKVVTNVLLTMSSSTPSNPFYLKYLGTPGNSFFAGISFTDVDASGSTYEIKNYNGPATVRCQNIKSVTLPVIPSSVSIGG